MKKVNNLPFIGTYGLDNQFRYFLLDPHNSVKTENYKKDIINCLKYDVLYHILPTHKSGSKTLDELRLNTSNAISIDAHTKGCIFSESVNGNRSGELIVTYKLSDDKKSLVLTLYDRNTILQPIRSSLDSDSPIEFTLVDNIVESRVEIKKGHKLSPKDIKVYHGDFKLDGHTYEDALKVIKTVKNKADYQALEPTDLLIEEPELKINNTNKK